MTSTTRPDTDMFTGLIPRRPHPTLRIDLSPPPNLIARQIVVAYRPRARHLSRRIARRICGEVAAFSDPRLHDVIEKALDEAVALFVDAMAGAPVRGATVAHIYRQLGSLEGRAGHNLDAMRAAHHIATQEFWREMTKIAGELELPMAAVSHLAEALMDYQRQLLEHATRGFAEPSPPIDPRLPLFAALVGDVRTGDLCALAGRAGWKVTDRVAVAVVPGGPVPAELSMPAPRLLMGASEGAMVVIGASGAVHESARAVVAATGRPVAVTWEVRLDETRHAVRWGLRAVDLVAEQVLHPSADGIVWCAHHQSELCLHADPTLRRFADEQLLAPLLEETPKRRLALAETMLVWLRARPSAPVVAEQLRVHEQTVRHRLKRIKELFGERLSDPAETVGLLTALESTTPRWRRDLTRR
ncbi:helix-turn-helix domain-containing protein [Nocardioides sp.]|uniref:PucR family transcriptional regulator n=1 Tax=Nocardioides sp. TaxID=35761 RepID=UPI00198BBEC7|nr:PucR family transcriptional regulator [Nocardioides sp.]MBC7278755.1 helix-turn-helix domain-containing protein [Nocardioides sp.]